MNSASETVFVETVEYRRFTEFCDACRRFRYVGLCYGPPGVGKTLSARRYALWDKVEAYKKSSGSNSAALLKGACASTAVFYTPPVVNAPGRVEREIAKQRGGLHNLQIARERLQEQPRMVGLLDAANSLRDPRKNPDHCRGAAADKAEKDFHASRDKLMNLSRSVPDPTTLVIIDESDRLKMASMEQVRDLFDRWDIGFVLVGMPGIEKRLARYPQLYSRVGFVHEFRPLAASETRRLLRDRWRPTGISLPADWITDEESFAAVLRITGGNFRLLDRLLTQIARVLEINQIDRVTTAVVDAARESLVIGAE